MAKEPAAPPLRADGLQIEEDRAFQRRFWRAQRLAWLAFAAACLVALLGLTGSGGAFQKSVMRFEGARVEFPRISRWEGPDELKVRFERPAPSHGLRIGRDFLDRFSVERIQPEPERSTLSGAAQSFVFAAEGEGPRTVTLDIRSKHFGWTRLEVGIGAETRTAHILILP